MNVASQYLVARTLFRCVCMELCHRFFFIFNDFDLYPNITQYCTTWMPPFWISRKILVGKIYSWYFCKYLGQKCYNLSFSFCKEYFHMKISFIFPYFAGRIENCPFYWQPWNWVKFQFPIKRTLCKQKLHIAYQIYIIFNTVVFYRPFRSYFMHINIEKTSARLQEPQYL